MCSLISSDIYVLKNILLRELKKKIFHKFEVEKNDLCGVLSRTISYGESDSVLIVGPPGSGKAKFVYNCIDALYTMFGKDSFSLVKLNGLIQINDILALRAIIQQLHVPEHKIFSISGSFSDNLLFLLMSLKSGSRNKSKPILFVIEEFQKFCGHKNQTLLYNLFDVAQTAQAPICVIGMTCRTDITELFEKRVKSRFSHRQILVYKKIEPKDICSIICDSLLIPENVQIQGHVSKKLMVEWNKSVKNVMSDLKLQQILRHHSEVTTSNHYWKSVIEMIISKSNQPYLTISHVEGALKKFSRNSKADIVKDLSILEICLIIAMKHQNELFDCEPLNFEIVFKRYLKFAVTSSINVVNRSVVYKAFERIKDLEFLLPISGMGKKTNKKEYLLYSFILTSEEVTDALNSYECLPTDVAQWASSDLCL